MPRSARTGTTSSPAATARHPQLLRRRRAELRHRLDALPRRRPVRQRRRRSVSTITRRGFDAIFENPIFAGADTSYWIRQTIPFAGGGRAVVDQRPQRHPQLAALVQGAGPVQLQQSRHDPARRRRRFRPHAGASRLSANVNHLWFAQHRDARGAAQRRARSRATSAGTCRRRRSGGRKSPRTSSSACPARCS